MEAMAAGTPVVMRDLPVLREIYTGAAAFANTRSGIADALLAAINAPPTGQLADARTLAARYSWQDSAAAHLRFYNRVTDLQRG
jgi:glycosyltransferase involved in cell wall biosynthesis